MLPITFSTIFTEDSKRIESLLRDLFPEISRAKWRDEIEKGRVTLNDRPAKVGYLLKDKDQISCALPESFMPGPDRIPDSNIPMPNIIFEDQYFFVFDKPRAMHSVLQKEDDPATLADYAVMHCKDSLQASPKSLDGGLVQRLDFYTSGLCIVAKSQKIWDNFHAQLKGHQVLKTYQGQVTPDISPEILAQAKKDGIFLEAKIISKSVNNSTINVSIRDGSRHIVRRSLKQIGCPLLGDEKYNGPPSLEEGFYLRCIRIEFVHPVSRKNLLLEIDFKIKN